MRYFLLFILILGVVSAAECITCEELQGVPQANILTEMDRGGATFTVHLYYENLSAEDPRPPIDNYAVLVEVSNSTTLYEIYRIYTDDEGAATFDFSQWSGSCTNFRVLYCPFCEPGSLTCAFRECLDYARFDTDATNITDIPLAPGASAPGTVNENKYMPALDSQSYCPPPADIEGAPAMCLPLLIIFSLLSGAMYLSGRNPFAAFNIGGARVGRHIRYQARGRGYSFSGMAALSAASSIASAAAVMGQDTEYDEKGKVTKRGGLAGLADQEVGLAKQRGGLFIKQVDLAGSAVKRGGKMLSFVGGKDAVARMEATAVGAGKRDQKAGPDMVRGAGGAPLFMAGSASFSPRLGELVGEQGMFGLGLLLYTFEAGTIGGLISNVVFRATGETMFEKNFINYEKRAQKDEKTLAGMEAEMLIRNEAGEIVGMRMKGASGERELQLLGPVQENADGSKTFVLAEPPAGAGREGKTLDGRITVTLNADNKIASISYVAEGVQGAANQLNPKGAAIVTIQMDANGKEQYIVQPLTPKEGGGYSATYENGQQVGPAQVVSGTAEQPVPVPVNSVAGLFVGSDMGSYVDNYNAGVENIKTASESVAQNYQRHRQRELEKLADQQDHAAVQHAGEQQREQLANQALTTAIGEIPGDSGSVVAISGGQNSYQVSKTANKVWKQSDVGSQLTPEDPSNQAQVAFSQFLASQPAADIAGKSPEELRSAFSQHLTQQYMASTGDSAATRAQVSAIMSDLPEDSFQKAHTATNNCVQNMYSSGMSQEMARRLTSEATLGELAQVQHVGGIQSNKDMAQMMVQSPGLRESLLPESARQSVREIRYLAETVNAANNRIQAAEQGDIVAVHNYSQQINESGVNYERVVTVHTVHNKDETAPLETPHKETGMTDYQQYVKSFDDTRRAQTVDAAISSSRVRDPNTGQPILIIPVTRETFDFHQKAAVESYEYRGREGNWNDAADVALQQHNMYSTVARETEDEGSRLAAQQMAGYWGERYKAAHEAQRLRDQTGSEGPITQQENYAVGGFKKPPVDAQTATDAVFTYTRDALRDSAVNNRTEVKARLMARYDQDVGMPGSEPPEQTASQEPIRGGVQHRESTASRKPSSKKTAGKKSSTKKG